MTPTRSIDAITKFAVAAGWVLIGEATEARGDWTERKLNVSTHVARFWHPQRGRCFALWLDDKWRAGITSDMRYFAKQADFKAYLTGETE